jgi:arylsulfatase A-like enzyme
MNATPLEISARRPPRLVPLGPMATVLLAILFGLCAGYLDIGILFFKRYCWNIEGHFRTARDFPWTVPAGHAFLMFVPAVFLAAVNRLRPVPMSLRSGTWLFATLAIWSALLRMPLYGGCGLLLAVGLGRLVGDAVASHGLRPRQTRVIAAAIFGVFVVLAFLSSGWQAIREYRTVAGLPPAPAAARNVILIVWDTVRAYSLGHYGYQRNTTPNLNQWARRRGVTYRRAVSPAPWTFPSHASFFTGLWPNKLNSQWKFNLDAPGPTLAEYLTTSGYQTAGFAANTNCCSYEFGLARGFAHFEDYALTPRSILSRTVAGNWILKNVLSFNDFYDQKWIGLQSRGAKEIDGSFFHWLSRRRPDRPFFAFFNYFDAHEPYIPAPGEYPHFGIEPRTPEDFQFLVDFVGTDKGKARARDLVMARDSYDDCISFLDDQLGRLLEGLQSQGLLENTDVIITSDHGEGLGIHNTMGHSYTVTLEEVGVPLVILSSAAPAGRTVDSPVSLRDLPATVVDLLGMSTASPFLGHSLAAYWKLAPGAAPSDVGSPAFSEQANAIAFEKQPGHGREHPGFQMSLVASDHHYVRDGMGVEQVYDLRLDPFEQVNLMGSAVGDEVVPVFRRMLLDVLNDNPGSVEVEKAYLANYRRWLEELVHGDSAQALVGGG